MEKNKETFRYTYSAEQQAEIKNIRKKYAPPEENKMEYLRRLDRKVSQKGTVISLVLGILGALILGVGMCCAMVWSSTWFIPGIVIGLIGIALVCCAYPIYIRITEQERKKYAPEILRLTDELMQ